MRKFYKFTTDQKFFSLLLQEHVEWQKIESEFSVEAKSGTRSLLLYGLSFTTVACHSLFLWGKALLYRYSYYPLPSGFLGIIYSACWGTITRLLMVQFISNEEMSSYSPPPPAPKNECKFEIIHDHAHTHVKIIRTWKSTLTLNGQCVGSLTRVLHYVPGL